MQLIYQIIFLIYQFKEKEQFKTFEEETEKMWRWRNKKYKQGEMNPKYKII